MDSDKSGEAESEVIIARRTESLDAPAILNLVLPSTEALFGRVNVVNLIEKAVLSITLCNDKDEVLGHASFSDHPNLPEVDMANWESWLTDLYPCDKANALNTLFLEYFVAKPEYSLGCAREIVRTMFNAVPELHYCFLLVPRGVYPEQALADIFHMMERKDETKLSDQGLIFACYRHNHVPVLHIRGARVEDHDDLVPIFNRHSSTLQKTYGDYFLAEMIEAQDETMKCIVAEVEGTAIGFMGLSSTVNVDLLNECYELKPFHGFKKPDPDDVLDPARSPTPAAESVPDETTKECERPASGKSTRSNSSSISRASKRSSASSQKGSRHAGSRASSKSSVKGEEPVIECKLSDGRASALSHQSEEESVSSVTSPRAVAIPETQSSDVSKVSMVSKSYKPPSPRARAPPRFIPTYKGPSSAFCIQLFCIDEKYEMRSSDFLAHAFELFPDRDFCVITVPHMVPEFPLLQQFVRVTPRVPSTMPHELYVFSRHGLLSDLLVRRAATSDVSGVEALVKSLNLSDSLMADLQQYNTARRDNDGTEIQAVVAECNKQIIGVAITRAEEDIEYIRSHYNIEDYIYFNHHRRTEHAHLYHFALNPIFKHFTKQFLKEVLRLGYKTCLYYPLYPHHTQDEAAARHSLICALSDLVPVRARRQISYPLEVLGHNAPSERILQTREPCALNHINRKLLLEPKVAINARIVVVGASDVGMAFLETLTFCPHLRFNNLSLISRHGLPGELPPDELRDQMLSSSNCFTQTDCAHLAMRAWVNVVYGNMTAIDRHKKHVVVNGNTIVPYDHLVLCTGTQHQITAPTEVDIANLPTNNEVVNSPDRRLEGTRPSNVFTVNDSYEAAVALHWLHTNVLDQSGKVIIYGNTLDTFTFIHGLITFGIDGSRIILVQHPMGYDVSQVNCFNNERVEGAIMEEITKSGVEVYTDYLLAQWNDGATDLETVTSASFTSTALPMRLECCAFFCFYKKMVDYDAFRAVNDACLVFDGRLVIDANFHTNDVAIRAAGPLTKFQRAYHADQWMHANFNSKEVGVQLANAMLTLFDPTLEPETEPPEDLLKLIPMYRSPMIRSAKLPGDYYYLHVNKPGLPTPLHVLMSHNDYGDELITGTPGGSTDYFRLHINQYKSVETITCLSKKPFSSSNLICLYGLHERYLNNLLCRFEEKMIDDFYRFFQEAWCLALFHDRFQDFKDEVRELLVTRPSADVEALEEKVRGIIEDDLSMNKLQKKALASDYVKSGAKQAVETRLLSFLSYNSYHLPMYSKPGMV